MNNEPTASGEPSHKAEPVAWRYWGFNIMNEPAWVYSDEWNKYYPLMGVEPLYTHPSKDLTGAVGSLSDEEIEIVVDEVINNLPPDDLKGKHSNFYRLFARAILKKATEK